MRKGDVIKAHGYLHERELRVYEWGINYSDILTELIQSAGKYCKRYASDLFIDWYVINNKLREGNDIDETYIFAMRTDGVDHKTFYEARKDEGYLYKEVWKLEIKGDTETRDIEMVLTLIEE